MMTVKPRTDRNAEGEVARLCRTLGASVQDVTEDDYGWDLLVEFPSQVQTAFPDVDPPLTRCFIQVKSTRSRRTSTRVKLSNALKFANDGTPCFVALATYPGGPMKHEALYLRHVWATDMAQALKAAREASAEGRPLHTRHLPVVFTAKEWIMSLFSEDEELRQSAVRRVPISFQVETPTEIFELLMEFRHAFRMSGAKPGEEVSEDPDDDAGDDDVCHWVAAARFMLEYPRSHWDILQR